MDVSVGDEIQVPGKKVGAAVRHGRVTEVIRSEPLELRVQWDDEHESVLYPSAGMVQVVGRAHG